jgi:hypothetical protein
LIQPNVRSTTQRLARLRGLGQNRLSHLKGINALA